MASPCATVAPLAAIRAGTRKGKEMEHVSWLAHEYASLKALHTGGS